MAQLNISIQCVDKLVWCTYSFKWDLPCIQEYFHTLIVFIIFKAVLASNMEEHKQINQQTKLNTNGKSSSFANKNFAHTLKTILRLPLVTHEHKRKDCSGEKLRQLDEDLSLYFRKLAKSNTFSVKHSLKIFVNSYNSEAANFMKTEWTNEIW